MPLSPRERAVWSPGTGAVARPRVRPLAQGWTRLPAPTRSTIAVAETTPAHSFSRLRLGASQSRGGNEREQISDAAPVTTQKTLTNG